MKASELTRAGNDLRNERQARATSITQPCCAENRWASGTPTVIQCFLIDPTANTRTKLSCRLVNPAIDGKGTSDHIRDMISRAVHAGLCEFTAVLLDDWYAEQGVMLQCERLGKIYWAAIKGNRLVDSSGGGVYQAVRDAAFNETNTLLGLLVWLSGRDGCLRAKVFRDTGPDGKYEYAATNQLFQGTAAMATRMFGRRSSAAALNSTDRLHADDKPAYGRQASDVFTAPEIKVWPSLRAMPTCDELVPGPYLFFAREGGWK